MRNLILSAVFLVSSASLAQRGPGGGVRNALTVTKNLQEALSTISNLAAREREQARTDGNAHRVLRYRYLSSVSNNIDGLLQQRVVSPWRNGQYQQAKQGFLSLSQNFNNLRNVYRLAPNPPRRIVRSMEEVNRLHDVLERLPFRPPVIPELKVSRSVSAQLQDLSAKARTVEENARRNGNAHRAQRFHFLAGVSNNIGNHIQDRVISRLVDRDFSGAKSGLDSLSQNFNNLRATYRLAPNPPNRVIAAMEDFEDLLAELKSLPFRQRR